MSCSCAGTDRCGCCEGTVAVTPRDVFNRPGLGALHRRVGEHEDFMETMRSAIARVYVDVDTDEIGPHGRMRQQRLYPLRALRTRTPDDPTIALLDLWAVVAEILSFYTERVAQEGYLRTATELMSVNELSRLVGWRRRPGVSASVYLAFTVDDTWTTPVVVPAGAKVQSLPDPGETAAFFETSAALTATPALNELRPRQHRPTFLPFAKADAAGVLYVEGTASRLTPNMPLLLVYGGTGRRVKLRFVAAAKEDFDAGLTRVTLRPKRAGTTPAGPARPAQQPTLDDLVRELELAPSRPPAMPARLALSPGQTFGPGSSAVDGLLAAFHPAAARLLGAARANAPVTAPSPLLQLLALRVQASLYGHNALTPANADHVRIVDHDHDWLYVPGTSDPTTTIDLDTTYDSIVAGSWVVVITANAAPLITRVVSAEPVSRVDYDLPGKVTRLVLADKWLQDATEGMRLWDVRSTRVLAAPDVLDIAEEPIPEPVCGAELELDRQVDGLQPGRWLIVTGERAVTASDAAHVFSTPHVMVSEVTLLAGVHQDVLRIDGQGAVVSPSAAPGASKGEEAPGLPDDRIHTFLQLATPLAYCYVRNTLHIYANVADATHGETHAEPLGSGDASRTLQTFTPKSSPLTYVAAPTVDGVDSTLNVYVNDVRWHEIDEVYRLGPHDRGYVTARDHTEKTSITFGDGRTGARLPGGVENVRAVYRSGIGKVGNVRAGQLKLLVTRTDGLRAVTNPQRASGGADADGIESTRGRAPLAVSALDRLVATGDYANFALTFAGIARASAARLPTRGGSIVHVTVAGVDDVPIDPLSDLAVNLLAALERYGDPYLPVMVAQRELRALVIGARVRIDADHLWDAVRPQLEAALLVCFGFDHRALAQDAYVAEALAAMQAVAGVDYVDLDVFASVPESATTAELAALGTTLTGPGAVQTRVRAHAATAGVAGAGPAPAQLVALQASVPTTLMLSEIPS